MEERGASWGIENKDDLDVCLGFIYSLLISVCLYTEVYSRGQPSKDIYSCLFILSWNVFNVIVSCLDLRHWTTLKKNVFFSLIPIMEQR